MEESLLTRVHGGLLGGEGGGVRTESDEAEDDDACPLSSEAPFLVAVVAFTGATQEVDAAFFLAALMPRIRCFQEGAPGKASTAAATTLSTACVVGSSSGGDRLPCVFASADSVEMADDDEKGEEGRGRRVCFSSGRRRNGGRTAHRGGPGTVAGKALLGVARVHEESPKRGRAPGKGFTCKLGPGGAVVRVLKSRGLGRWGKEVNEAIIGPCGAVVRVLKSRSILGG